MKIPDHMKNMINKSHFQLYMYLCFIVKLMFQMFSFKILTLEFSGYIYLSFIVKLRFLIIFNWEYLKPFNSVT